MEYIATPAGELATSELQHPPRVQMMFKFETQEAASKWFEAVTTRLDGSVPFAIVYQGRKSE